MSLHQVQIVDYVLKHLPFQVDGNYNGTYFPGVQRVTYNGSTTIVFFNDGTKCTVECSPNDKYDRQTALAYAICKRLLGKVGRVDKNGRFIENEIDDNGFGSAMKKIVDAGFDQKKAEAEAAKQKREAKAKHEAAQKAAHEAAWQKRVQKRAEEIRLEREAEQWLADHPNGFKNVKNAPKVINETKTETSYVRPNKPFSQFTQEEKRAYWREQKSKRRS